MTGDGRVFLDGGAIRKLYSHQQEAEIYVQKIFT